MFLVIQKGPKPFSIGWRACTDIDRHVKNTSGDDGDELGLRERIFLKVESSEYSFLIQAHTVLKKIIIYSECSKFLFVVAFKKYTPIVRKELGFNQKNTRKGSRETCHTHYCTKQIFHLY